MAKPISFTKRDLEKKKHRKPGSALKDTNKIYKREKPETSNGSKDKKAE